MLWRLDGVHFARPLSVWMQAVFPPPFELGFTRSFAAYGMLSHGKRIRTVDGFPYMQTAPLTALAAPIDRAGFDALAANGEVAIRLSRAVDCFENRRWRQDIADFDTIAKPHRIAVNRRLQEVEPASLTTPELIEHLEDCTDEVTAGLLTHHSLHPACMLPIGDFIAQVVAWTGRSPSECLRLLTGSSPMSTEAADLPRAVAAAATSEDAAERRREMWEILGSRLLYGCDPADPCVFERPEILEASIAAADLDRSPPDDGLLAEVRTEVPPEFDDLLAEARASYRVRDERTILNDSWTLGLARIALLEAGRRLNLLDPGDATALTPDLVAAGLRGKAIDVAAAHERAQSRRAGSMDERAPTLGEGAPFRVPEAWLPAGAARQLRAFDAYQAAVGVVNELTAHASDSLRGIAASPGVFRGRARVVPSHRDIDGLTRDQVLVTSTASPSVGVFLPSLGAIVTDRGGAMAHVAVVAREYGLPAVVGCRDATRRIPDGALVHVDGGAGTVEVIA